MKKTILSLAMFGAFTGAAMAQSHVQLYGIIDMGVEHLSYDNSSVNRLSTGAQSTDRIGVRGSEDLGGGLSAFFTAETGFCANGNDVGSPAPGKTLVYTGVDQGAQYQAGGSYCSGGNFMGRMSVLGLKGGFGTLEGGRFYSFNYDNLVKVDPFGTGMTGAIKNIDPAGYTYVRLSQAVGYITPNFSGLTAGLIYAFGAQSQGNSNGQAYELNVNYKNGPILAGLDYLHHNQTAAKTYDPYTFLAKEFGSAQTVDSGDSFTNKITQIYGGYDFGVATVTALYSEQKYGEGLIYAGANQAPDLKVWMLGVTVPVGPGHLLASYTQRKDSHVADTQARQYALGYTYPLSKRTNVYTSYARISNDSKVDQYVGDNGFMNQGTLGGQSSSGFALGIRHMF